ncbi:MAG TPA: hypothetical protein VNW54_03725 [Granulicella sp.]|nr:hypothetical protein [Granulicella sp.]
MSTGKGPGDDEVTTKMTGSGFNWRTLEQRRALFCSLTLTLALAGGGWREAKAQGGMGQEPGGAVAMGPQGRMVRGTVTAAAADHLTVTTEGGDTYQVMVTTNTRVMKERQPVKLADVHAGDGVGAMGVIDAATKTVHAAALFVVDAAQVKKAREDMGKSYITGKVTAIDELNLTIQRPDGVSQTIAVDESTSFRKGTRRMGMAMRGDPIGAGTGPGMGPGGGQGQGGEPGESITLADVKVGDRVFGPGSVKAGVFVPTQLVVVDAALTGRRRAPGAGEDGTAQPAAAQPPK